MAYKGQIRAYNYLCTKILLSENEKAEKMLKIMLKVLKSRLNLC